MHLFLKNGLKVSMHVHITTKSQWRSVYLCASTVKVLKHIWSDLIKPCLITHNFSNKTFYAYNNSLCSQFCSLWFSELIARLVLCHTWWMRYIRMKTAISIAVLLTTLAAWYTIVHGNWSIVTNTKHHALILPRFHAYVTWSDKTKLSYYLF